jgi:predicted acetyltransferase
MRLEAASINSPDGLAELLADLGAGENGFGGTPVFSSEMSLTEYLQQCIERTDVSKLLPGYVPRTVFWVIDENGEAIGMVRMRHCLNDGLRELGGHIGYYIRQEKRNQGYGKEALRLALVELKKIGEKRALLTVDMDNFSSIKVIEANGGIFESEGQSLDGKRFGRFWIALNEVV